MWEDRVSCVGVSCMTNGESRFFYFIFSIYRRDRSDTLEISFVLWIMSVFVGIMYEETLSIHEYCLYNDV